jgi:hypothetical protein
MHCKLFNSDGIFLLLRLIWLFASLKTARYTSALLAEQESGILLDASGIKKIHLMLWDQAIKSNEVHLNWLWLLFAEVIAFFQFGGT